MDYGFRGVVEDCGTAFHGTSSALLARRPTSRYVEVNTKSVQRVCEGDWKSGCLSIERDTGQQHRVFVIFPGFEHDIWKHLPPTDLAQS